MDVKIGEIEFNTSNISREDIEKLKKMLPELQNTGNVSQLDIILEAIFYIKSLKYSLEK